MTDLYSKWAILSSQCIPDSQKECPALFPLSGARIASETKIEACISCVARGTPGHFKKYFAAKWH